MDRSRARCVLVAGLAMGVLAESVFNGPAPGIGVSIVTVALLAAAWWLRRRGTAPDPLDAWLPVAAFACAACVALTGDRFLALVDSLGALAFGSASVAAASGIAVTRRSAGAVATLAAWLLEGALAGAGRMLAVARPVGGVPRPPRGTGALVRGLVLGIPLATIFAVLFASADPIFRRGLDEVLAFRIDLGDVPGRLLFSAAAAWLAAGILSVAATGIPATPVASLGAAAAVSPQPRLIGVAEALVILCLVDAVVGAFVVLQVAYLFGGLDTLAAIGSTYSDYARRGFFELVAAACLAGGLIALLDAATAARPRTFVVAALALLGLTGVVVASAALRLDLYQQAYGWTELRFYVAAAIATLAVALALAAVLLVRDRMRWLGHGLIAIGLVALLVLNALAPGEFVAERNIERALDPSLVPPGGRSGLDVAYLGALGDDAVPVMVATLPRLAEPDRSRVLRELRRRHLELAGETHFTAPTAWNLSRVRAVEALRMLP